MTKKNNIRIYLNAIVLTLIFFVTSKLAAQTITTTGVSGTSFCAGDITTVSYSVTGSFSAGNTFTAQLSDENGSFTSPTNIGSVVSTTGGNISVVFPLSATSSYIYRIRVVANNPLIIGTDNGNNLNINPIPTANAGPDQLLCGNSTVTLAGLVGSAAPFANWSSTGTGTFNNTSNLNAIYTPSAADVSNGSVILILTTNDPAGPCVAAKDSMTVWFLQPPIVSAGTTQNLCVNTASVNLSGSISGSATSATWSTLGSGSFNNNSLLNAVYTPSANDVNVGFAKLVLTTNDPAGPCTANRDTVRINFNPLAVTNAGFDQTICAGNNISLSAATNATGGSKIWTSSGNGFFDNDTILTPTYFPSATDIQNGSVTFTFTTTNPSFICDNSSDNLLVTINQLPSVNAGVDITVCESNNSVSLSGSLSGTATSGTWSTQGTGTFNNVNSLNAVYTPSVADKTAGMVYLVLTTNDPAGPCGPAQDMVQIIFNQAATVNAGIDQLICSKTTINLAATLGGSASFGAWTSSSNPSYITFNNPVRYLPTTTDIANGKVVLTFTTNDPFGACSAVKDSLEITINQAVTVNAGIDQIVCNDAATISLSGSFGNGATSATWSTTGSGSFNNTNLANAIYTPSANDKNSGLVKLIYTTNDPAGPCNAERDTVNIQFIPYTTVANAGLDQQRCTNDTVNLAASTNITGNVSWTTSGTGFFNNNSLLTPTYYPSNADVLNGNVILTFSIINPSIPCSFATDNLLVTFNQLPTANAGADQTVCENELTVSLSGSLSGTASFGIWSTQGTGTFDNINSLNAIYTPSPADKAAGFVNLVLTTNDPIGPCGATNDMVKITFNAAPTVNAGFDQNICSNSNINLNATLGGSAIFGSWTSSTNTNYISYSNPNVYLPSANEIANGKAVLTFTTNDPFGPCSAASDSLEITINMAHQVNAGSNQTICNGTPNIALWGAIGGTATGATWSTLGNGSFDRSNKLTANYFPSVNDVNNGSVLLVLTTNNQGGVCTPKSDTVEITILPFSNDVNVGPDRLICAVDSINLSATASIIGNANWTTSGTGNFNNSSSLTPTYYLSNADKTSSSFVLTFTVDNPNIPCSFGTDSLTINIRPNPTADAGKDQTVCASDLVVNVQGTMGGTASIGNWATLGTGSFNNANNLNAIYIPSKADKDTGFVDLLFTSADATGFCGSAQDFVRINLNPAAIVNAGLNQTICSNTIINAYASLEGSANFGSWTSSTNSNYVSYSNPVSYLPTATDIANGKVILTFTSNDPFGPCSAGKDSIEITINQAVSVYAGIDQVLCNNTTAVSLSGVYGNGATSATWSTTGTGTFNNASLANAIYTPSLTDISNGFVNLVYTTNNPAAPCLAANDTVNIQLLPFNTTANAGPDQFKCAYDSVNLTATSNITGNIIWTTSGSGMFNNNSSLTPTYYPSSADVFNGNVTLTFSIINQSIPCSFASDNVMINFNQLPLVDAGNDINICESNTNINLLGAIGGAATSATWSTLGSGTFNNINNLNAIYTASAADRTAGFVNLVLTTNDPTGPCLPTQDTVKIIFDQAATTNAGLDQVICSNGSINVSATIGGSAIFGSWTSSTNPNFVSYNNSTSYTPNSAEFTNGKVVLTFTTNDPTGACEAASDSLEITINPIPVANAGTDQTICSNTNTITLSGLIGGSASSSYWKTTGTGTFNDSSLLGAIYTPSAADKASGSTKLVLITNDPSGPCVAVNDTLQLIFKLQATANVGVDKTICAPDSVLLSVATNITGGTGSWTTTGTGFFSNNSSLSPSYFPSAADMATGSIKLAFSNYNATDVCANVTDTLVLTINQPVQVTAGTNQSICANVTSIALTGTIGGSANSCSWTSTGIGTFINRLNDTATYNPSAFDKSKGFVKLVLSTNDPIGPCPLQRDTVTITLNPVAVVNAGPDQNICGSSPFNIYGSYNSVAAFAYWTNTTVPAFNSYDSVFTYNPTAADLANGQTTFILTSSDPIGPCPAAVDSMNVKFYQPVTANAGPDQVLCATTNSVHLSGTFGGGASSILWVTTDGTGSFDNPSATTTIYRPSAADLAAKMVHISITTDNPVGPCFAGFEDIDIQFKDSLVSFESQTLNAACDSTTITFINKTTSLGNNYIWDFGDGDTSSSVNPVHTFKKVGVFNVNLKASNLNGCLENTANQIIINSIKPLADFSVNNLTQCLFDNGFDFSNNSQGGTVSWITNVLWDFGDATNSNATFPSTKRYVQAGDYRIMLRVQASNGCFDSVSKIVTVNPGPKKPVITLSAGNILVATPGTNYQWFLNGTPINGANANTYKTTGYGFYSVKVDSTNGCGTMSDNFELKYTSINEHQNLVNSVSIYPNPNSGIFNIEAEQNLNFTVYDISGKEILLGNKVQKIHQIDLINYSSGIYFLKIFNDKDQFTTKIIKN